MPLPPITRFSSLATNPSSTNNNNGLYAPSLNTAQIAAIPAKTKVNGGIWYNEDAGQLEIVTQNKVQPVAVGASAVFGPGVSVTNNMVTFGDNTGALISDSGIAKDNVVIAAGAATANKLLAFTGVGKNVQESGFVADDIVTNTGAGAENNIVIFDAGGGKVIKDSGVSINQVPNPAPLLRFSDSLRAPNVTVNEIGNLGHIRFINDVSSIYVDTLTSVRFFPYDTQICSVFTSEVGSLSLSTSESALLEVHSDSGALLLSRLTTPERTALQMVSGIDGTNGMLLFNTDTLTFNGYDGTDWRDLPLLNTDGTLTVADPVVKTNAATKAYVDAAVSGIPSATVTLNGDVTGSGVVTSPISTTLNMTLDQIKAPVADLDLNNKNIINLLDPTTAQQAATKNYVDNAIAVPAAAKFIIQTANASVPNAQVLGSLTTGLLKNTTTTGVLSIGVPGTDYYSPGNPTRIIDDTINFFIGTVAGNLALTGTFNTGVGITCLESLTTGTDNTATGSAALKQNTTGLSNCGFGARGLALNVLGSYNSAFGAESLRNNNSNSNSAFGYQTLFENVTGSNNSAFGYQTLFENIAGSNNSAFGYQALPNNTADNNSAFGYQALFDNITGTNNNCFGSQSLQANVVGSFNSAFGTESLKNNLTDGNSAFGHQALQTNTTGSGCAAFGYQSLLLNNAVNNSAFGYQALANNTSLSECCAFGYRSLYSLTGTSSGRNSAFGTLALQYLATGGGANSAFGWNALGSPLIGTSAGSSAFGYEAGGIGDFNCSFGYSAMVGSNGTGNCGFGFLALQFVTGSGNLAAGFRALRVMTSGSNNTGLGTDAGVLQTNYNNCSFIGAGADASVNNLTNAIAIGYQASVGASNTMVLGGSGANQLSVGIGITPNAQFQLPSIHANRKIVLFETANNDHQVIGFGTAAGIFRSQIDAIASNYIWNAGINSTTSNELMRLTGTGNLLIGTTTQTAKINVFGGVFNVPGEETCIRATATGVNTPKIELIGATAYELRTESGSGVFSIYNRSASQYAFVTGGTTFIQRQSSAIYYGAVSTPTVVGVAGVFVKLNWPAAISSTLFSYTYLTSRLTYQPIGQITPTVNQKIDISLTAGHNGATVGEITTFALYKNGVLIASVRDTITAFAAVTGTIYSVKTIPLVTGTTVVSGDFFEIFVTNTVARTITVTNFNIAISST